jgi:hypothetical protein
MKDRIGGLLGAAAIVAVFALAPVNAASANAFTDNCTAGSGLFDDAGCKCLDGKVTDSGDRGALIAYFKMNADILKGSTPPSTAAASATMSKGTDLLGKYSPDCLK